MCDKCAKMRAQSGVYGFDFGGIGSSAINVVAAFGGYVGAQTVDNTVTMLKDNAKTSGMVWTGASILLNVMFPQISQNKMLQSATIGAGVFGLKRLNQGYAFLKGINATPNFANTYAERMARAQAVAMSQAQGLPQNSETPSMPSTPSMGNSVMNPLTVRLAA